MPFTSLMFRRCSLSLLCTAGLLTIPGISHANDSESATKASASKAEVCEQSLAAAKSVLQGLYAQVSEIIPKAWLGSGDALKQNTKLSSEDESVKATASAEACQDKKAMACDAKAACDDLDKSTKACAVKAQTDATLLDLGVDAVKTPRNPNDKLPPKTLDYAFDISALMEEGQKIWGKPLVLTPEAKAAKDAAVSSVDTSSAGEQAAH